MAWATPKLNPDQRGYDLAHRKARKAAALRHRPTDPCARCGHALGPMGPWLHYDHDSTRTTYLGFSHGSKPCPHCGRKCNIRAGAQAGARRGNRRKVYLLDLTGNGCPICGRKLDPTVVAAGRKYCSQRCGWIAHKNDPPKPKTPRKVKAKPEPKPCAMCGQPLPKGRKRHCSDRCQLEYNARAVRERYRAAQGLAPTWDKVSKPHTAGRW